MSKKIKIIVYIVCIALICGTIFYRYKYAKFSDQYLDNLLASAVDSKGILISGKVVTEPEDKKTLLRYIVEIHGDPAQGPSKILVRDSTQYLQSSESKVSPNISSKSPTVKFGDIITFTAKLKKPLSIKSDDGRIFDYAHYLSKDDVFYIAETSDVKVDEKATIEARDFLTEIQTVLFVFKNKFIENIEASIPAPHSYLGEGLVISGKGSLDKDLLTEFQRVGLIHIVVLSGFNISIVGETVFRIFSFLPKIMGAVLGSISIVLFGLMTGGGATVWRSVIMSIIGIYARVTERRNSALISLFFAGSLMLIITPKLFFHDPSFQLSFMATLGLILFAEPFQRILSKNFIRLFATFRLAKLRLKVTHFESLLELVSSTLATQVFTLPMIISFSGVVSIIALPVNIVVLPLIPLTMLLVFITGVVSFMSFSISALPAFVSWILLSLELWIVHIASAQSLAAISLKPISGKVFFVSYVFLFLLAIVLNFEKIFSIKREDADVIKSDDERLLNSSVGHIQTTKIPPRAPV